MDKVSRKKLVQIFNKQITEFIQQSLITFDSLKINADVIKSIKSIETTIQITPAVPITLFYRDVYVKYKDELDNQNENFFLNMDDQDILLNETMNFLKKVYLTTTQENRKIIWDYVNRLKILSLRYFKPQ